MKFFHLIGAALSLSLISPLVTAQENRDQWDQPYVNGIAAIVEDSIITLEDLRREIAPLVPQIRTESRNRQEFDQRIGEVSSEVLQQLIDRILILREFESS